MGFYGERVLPHIIKGACGSARVQEQRAKVVPLASGRVLEVGMGPALNLPFYDRDSVELVWGLEPSEGMRRLAEPRLASTDLDVRWLGLPGEEIPLDDNTADSIVLTYTLCSIPDWETALAQMRRVLKPDGHLYFSEHGQAPDESVRRLQDRLTPIWKSAAGGCHINRPIDRLLERGGFEIESLDAEYRGFPKVATFTYWGIASAG